MARPVRQRPLLRRTETVRQGVRAAPHARSCPSADRGTPHAAVALPLSLRRRNADQMFARCRSGARSFTFSILDRRFSSLCNLRAGSADRVDESVADEVTGPLRAAFVRPAADPPQLLEPNGAGKAVKVLRPAQRPGQLPPDDVVHYVRTALKVLDDPRSQISVA